MSAYISPDGKQKKKSGCFNTLAKLFLVVIAVSVAVAVIAPKTPDAPVARVDQNPVSSSGGSRLAPEHPDYLSGTSLGEAVGKEMASQEGGRPYPKGVELMAKARLDEAKPANQKEWIKGFEAGFTKGWDSIRGAKNLKAYTKLTWETAKTGVRLYDINEDHVATVVLPDPDTGTLIVRYTKNGSVEKKNFQAMAEFWSVKKEPSGDSSLNTHQPADRPKQVTLKAPVTFELQGGKGSATAPSGARVDVAGYSSGRVRVRFAEVEKEIAAGETDFEAQITASSAQRQQQEQQEIARLAAIELAKLKARKTERDALNARIEADAGKEIGDTMARTLIKVHLQKVLDDYKSTEFMEWSDVTPYQYDDGKYAWGISFGIRTKNRFGAFVRSKQVAFFRHGKLFVIRAAE